MTTRDPFDYFVNLADGGRARRIGPQGGDGPVRGIVARCLDSVSNPTEPFPVQRQHTQFTTMV